MKDEGQKMKVKGTSVVNPLTMVKDTHQIHNHLFPPLLLQDVLWQAVWDNTIQQVVSDHSPCTPHLKLPGQMNFMEAWGDIASVQLGEYCKVINR